MRLFTALADVTAEALARRDRPLASAALWAWAVDAVPRDHEFIVRVGVVDTLTRLVSLNARALELSADAPAAAEPWEVWSGDATRLRLLDGSLSKQEVLAHLLAAPPKYSAGVEWLRAQGAAAPGRAASLSISEVLELHASFTAVLAQGLLPGAAATLALDAMVPTDKDPSVAVLPADEAAARPALLRAGSLAHHTHSQHQLSYSAARYPHCSCNVCHASIRATGSIAAWYCSDCDFDACENCFAERRAAEWWEAGLVSEARADFVSSSGSRLSDCKVSYLAPEVKRPLYLGKE